MSDLLATALELIRKTPSQILLPICIVSSALLMCSEETVSMLGLTDIVTNYRAYIGLVAIVGWAVLFTVLICWLMKIVSNKCKVHKKHRVRVASLCELTDDEKDFLSPYIFENKNSQKVELGNGVVGGLIAKGIIFRSANQAYWGEFPYNLQPWARRYLLEHPGLLQ